MKIICYYCGTEFQAKRRDQKYCSTQCSDAAYLKARQQASENRRRAIELGERPIFIYGLVDPLDNQIRYVGKAVNPEVRLRQHIYTARRRKRNDYSTRWIQQVLRAGREPAIVIIERATQDNWQERERYWIATLPKLTNTTPGGEGVNIPHTPEWIAKIAAARRGQKFSDEALQNIRASHVKIHATSCINGHPYTPETLSYRIKGGKRRRVCLICKENLKRTRRERNGWKEHNPQYCKRGHHLSGYNLRLLERPARDGRPARIERICRECVRQRNNQSKRRGRIRRKKYVQARLWDS